MNELNKDYLMELKGEHKTVARLIEEIKGLIQKKDTQGIAAHMVTLKSGLLSHLKKEDDKLYADLLKTAKEKNIEMVSITVNTFSTEMKGIAARILGFFDKYPNKDEIARITADFSKDFQGVYEDIMKRVNNEEKVLYPMYEKHCC
ncbi:MAG: hemerythrin domain-containing protein [Deltaproteobacteria bacterium]|nr:hemerythrin domain-containing protein [Deltaproteobacteria bacterium]